jgi:hypothetical protein
VVKEFMIQQVADIPGPQNKLGLVHGKILNMDLIWRLAYVYLTSMESYSGISDTADG